MVPVTDKIKRQKHALHKKSSGLSGFTTANLEIVKELNFKICRVCQPRTNMIWKKGLKPSNETKILIRIKPTAVVLDSTAWVRREGWGPGRGVLREVAALLLHDPQDAGQVQVLPGVLLHHPREGVVEESPRMNPWCPLHDVMDDGAPLMVPLAIKQLLPPRLFLVTFNMGGQKDSAFAVNENQIKFGK